MMREKLEISVNKHQLINWFWIKGHSGHLENEEVDALAKQAIKKGSECAYE